MIEVMDVKAGCDQVRESDSGMEGLDFLRLGSVAKNACSWTRRSLRLDLLREAFEMSHVSVF
jgi:hypothetical protein